MCWKAELLSRPKFAFEESRSQVGIDDNTTVMKGGHHHQGQLHYEFQTKIRSIVPCSTAFHCLCQSPSFKSDIETQ